MLPQDTFLAAQRSEARHLYVQVHTCRAFIECNAIVFFSFLFYFSVFWRPVVSALASLSCPQLSVNYCCAVLGLLRQIKIDWLIDWLIYWLIDWFIDWLIEWVSDWLIDWFAIRTSVRSSVRLSLSQLWFTVQDVEICFAPLSLVSWGQILQSWFLNVWVQPERVHETEASPVDAKNLTSNPPYLGNGAR